jgi:hypothetical protein
MMEVERRAWSSYQRSERGYPWGGAAHDGMTPRAFALAIIAGASVATVIIAVVRVFFP